MLKSKKTKESKKKTGHVYACVFIPNGFGEWIGYWPCVETIRSICSHSLGQAMKECGEELGRYLINKKEENWPSFDASFFKTLKAEPVVVYAFFFVSKKKLTNRIKIDIIQMQEVVQIKHSKKKMVLYANDSELVNAVAKSGSVRKKTRRKVG
jgi:hypothetical protein